jgi:hypothetical protein
MKGGDIMPVVMLAPILLFRTKTYAKAIYVYNTNRLTGRDGYPGVAEGYYTPVEQYAAETYTLDQIDLALACGWITQVEYDETVAFIPVV